MSNKVILSGGAGYIGSHVALALRQAGFDPVVLDNLCTGHEWAVAGGILERGDIGDAAFVRDACTRHNPVALLHFAAFIEVGESVRDPQKYFTNNTVKAKILFDTVRDCGVKHAVFSSTAAVYGIPARDGAITEDFPLCPINPYGDSKLQAETYLRTLDASGLYSVTLRYFNAAGAAVDHDLGEAHWPESHLIPRAVLAALGLVDSFAIFGTDYPTPDGTAVRDYIHVMDLAAAHVAALRYLMRGGATTVCNLGTGAGNSVKEVVAAVSGHFGGNLPVTYGARREGDPPRLVADATKARTLLGWTPTRTLHDIVASAVAWHRGKRYQDVIASRAGISRSVPS